MPICAAVCALNAVCAYIAMLGSVLSERQQWRWRKDWRNEWAVAESTSVDLLEDQSPFWRAFWGLPLRVLAIDRPPWLPGTRHLAALSKNSRVSWPHHNRRKTGYLFHAPDHHQKKSRATPLDEIQTLRYFTSAQQYLVRFVQQKQLQKSWKPVKRKHFLRTMLLSLVLELWPKIKHSSPHCQKLTLFGQKR